MRRMSAYEAFEGNDHRRYRTLHVRRAATVEHAVTLRGHEWRRTPRVLGTRGHDIRMPKEGQHGALTAVRRPQVVDVGEAQVLDVETCRGEQLGDPLEAARVVRCDRAAADEV